MRNALEFSWIIAAIIAGTFVTFMAVFAVLAFTYWLIGVLHLGDTLHIPMML